MRENHVEIQISGKKAEIKEKILRRRKLNFRRVSSFNNMKFFGRNDREKLLKKVETKNHEKKSYVIEIEGHHLQKYPHQFLCNQI